MPQTLIETSPQDAHLLEASGVRRLHAAHAQLASILQSRLGDAHARLLATPRALPDGRLAWDTPLAGAVRAAASLDDATRDALRVRAQTLAAEIGALAQRLRGEGTSSGVVADLLDRAVVAAPGEWLFSVGGQPVLAMWGWGNVAPQAPAAPPPAVRTPAPVAPDDTVTPAVPADEPPDAVPPVVTGPTRVAGKPWLRGLPWLLLLLLLTALVLLGLRRCARDADDEALANRRLAEAQAQNDALDEELKRRREKTRYMCVPDPAPPPASAPVVAASAPTVVASAPEPAPSAPPDPYGDLKKRIASAGQNCAAIQSMLKDEALLQRPDSQAAALRQQLQSALAAHCKDEMIQQARTMCPGERPKELAPELAIVFDASGSMKISLDASPMEIELYEQIEKMGPFAGIFGSQKERYGRITRDPQRIVAARDAAVRLVDKAPTDTDIGLVLVDECPSARSAGFFPPARRPQLVAGLRSIQPREGTPLADGIAKAAQMVDGVNREAVIVVISDGEDSCGAASPCEVARRIARAKPHLHINVVDINGAGAGQCLASATGGKVYTARSVEEVLEMTNKAGADALGPQDCKKKN